MDAPRFRFGGRGDGGEIAQQSGMALAAAGQALGLDGWAYIHMEDPLDVLAFGELVALTEKRRGELADDQANRTARAVGRLFPSK